MSLKVTGIDFLKSQNTQQHHTDGYNIKNLVVRRGQPFQVQVSLNRELRPADKLSLRFCIGKQESLCCHQVKPESPKSIQLPLPGTAQALQTCTTFTHIVLDLFLGENPMKNRGSLLSLKPEREDFNGWKISVVKKNGKEVEPVGKGPSVQYQAHHKLQSKSSSYPVPLSLKSYGFR